MLTGSWDNTARLWDVRTGAPVGEPMRHELSISAMAFSHDGERVLTGSTARLWETRTGTPSGQPMRHEGAVLKVPFSPDGERVVTGSDDKTARLWDARTGAAVGEPMRHKDIVDATVFSPDGEGGEVSIGGDYGPSQRQTRHVGLGEASGEVARVA